jgi:hypothetical protein
MNMEFGSGNKASKLEQITNNGEIKGFKPVTQIEYDALTTEQKEDGTVYLIEEA